MKKVDSFDNAIVSYKDILGECPEITEIIDLYHSYRNCWKQYRSFSEYLIYNVTDTPKL